jgi:hypothetical protein
MLFSKYFYSRSYSPTNFTKPCQKIIKKNHFLSPIFLKLCLACIVLNENLHSHTTIGSHYLMFNEMMKTFCLASPRPMIPLLCYEHVSCGVSYPWKNWEAWRKMLMGQHKLKFYTISWKASWPPQASKSKRKKHSSSTTKWSVSKLTEEERVSLRVTVILYYGKPDMNNSIILYIYVCMYMYTPTLYKIIVLCIVYPSHINTRGGLLTVSCKIQNLNSYIL